MNRPFMNTDQLVLIAEPDPQVAETVKKVVGKFGFKAVHIVNSSAALVKTLEVDQPGWVITSATFPQGPTALHILELFSKYKIFSESRISILVDKSYESCLPKAFELGALSWHRKPLSEVGLTADFELLFGILERSSFNDALASAAFISRYLKEKNRKEDVLVLYRNLFALYPDLPEALFALFDALVLNIETIEAKKLLGRARLLEYPGWEEYAKSVTLEGETIKPELGVNAVVIASADETLRTKLADILAKVTDARLYSFGNGKEAYEFCSFHPHVDLVIAEWKLPQMQGPQFVQRLRQEMPPSLPIIVIGHQVSEEDKFLMEEVGVSELLEKPLRDKNIITGLATALQQEHRPTTAKAMERKLQQYLEIGDKDRAERLLSQINKQPSEGLKLYAQGLISYFEKNLSEARSLFSLAHQKGASKIKTIHFLAMANEESGEPAAALRYYLKAQEISPRNIVRLCKIIELNRELEKLTDAEFYIKVAQNVDLDNTALTAEEAKLALKFRNTKRLQEVLRMGTLSNEQLATLTNQMARQLVKEGKIHAATSIYSTCLQVLPPQQILLRSRVSYNLALAYIRQNDYPKALNSLSGEISSAETPLKSRITNLRNAIQVAIKNGTSISFKDPSKPDKEDDFEEIETGSPTGERKVIKLELSKASVGDICCYKIYNAPEGSSEKWEAALRAKIKFTPMVGLFR